MKNFLLVLMLSYSFYSYSEQSKTVGDITIEELTEIVREIIQESLQKCMVKGTMEGRAKVSLAVVGSVVAQMSCNFDEVTDNSETSEIN